MREWMTESRKSESNIPGIPNTIRDSVHKNSQENAPSDPVQSPLPRLDLPQAAFDSEDREETAESLCTDETALETPETLDYHRSSLFLHTSVLYHIVYLWTIFSC